jgi:hypothetical protein
MSALMNITQDGFEFSGLQVSSTTKCNYLKENKQTLFEASQNSYPETKIPAIFLRLAN